MYLERYSSTMRKVTVGVQFDRIGEIDTMNEKYYAEVTIEASWEDDGIVDKYNEAVDWNPNLCIDNIISESERMVKYKTEHNYNHRTCKVTQLLIVKGYYWERLEIHNFPLDIQKLSIIVTTTHNRNEIRLLIDKNKQYNNEHVIKMFYGQQKWRLYNYFEITYEFSQKDTRSQRHESKAAAELGDSQIICLTSFASRRGHYYFLNAYFLIFLISICAFNIFAVDCKLVQNRLQNTFTLLLTSISFKWVINRSLPFVAYLSLLDMYAIANICFLCLVSVWHALVGAFWEDKKLAKELDKWLLVVFAVLFILIHLILFQKLFLSYKEILKLKEKEKWHIRMLTRATMTLKDITTNVMMEYSRL